MADAPTVAALLLNWRQHALTRQCLDDLLQVDGETLHVFVIDNGSGDVDVQALGAAIAALPPSRHRVELVALPANTGFTGGMNHGFARAAASGAPFALVLNNDLRLPKDFLAPLCDTLRNDPRVAAVGPGIVHPDGTVWAEGGEVGFAPNALRLRRHGKPPSDRRGGPRAVGFLPGACLLLRTRDVAERGFDDRYFMYWEDVELCERLRRAGGRIVWLPWVRVEHLAGRSSGGGRSPLRKFLMACNCVRYLRSHGTARAWAAWLVFDVLLWPLSLAGGLRSALAKLRGTALGLAGHRASAADVERYLLRR